MVAMVFELVVHGEGTCLLVDSLQRSYTNKERFQKEDGPNPDVCPPKYETESYRRIPSTLTIVVPATGE